MVIKRNKPEEIVTKPPQSEKKFWRGFNLQLSTNVRLWLLADIQPHPELCLLYPRKRTL